MCVYVCAYVCMESHTLECGELRSILELHTLFSEKFSHWSPVLTH